MSAPGGGAVRVLSQCGLVEDVAVTTGCQDDRVRRFCRNFAGTQVARDNTDSATVFHNQIKHLGVGMQGDSTGCHLTLQRTVRRDL